MEGTLIFYFLTWFIRQQVFVVPRIFQNLNKWTEKPIFVDNEKIPLVTYRDDHRKGDHDNDCDVYNTPNTTVEEKTFTTSSYTNKNHHQLCGLGKKWNEIS